MYQQELLSAFKEENYVYLWELLNRDDIVIDPDYFYGEPDNGTLLDLANRANEGELIGRLISKGATAWRKDELTGKLVINEIFKNLDPRTAYCIWSAIEWLAENGDEKNASIMKIAVAENDVEAMVLLARSYSLAPSNHRRKPRPHVELLQGSIEAVRVFIEFFDVDKEFQTDSQGCARSCREIILQKYPELEEELPIQSKSPSKLQGLLFSYLNRGAPELFLSRVAEVSTEILDGGFDKRNMTYLHLACVRNYIEVVDVLLKKKVQLNKVARAPSVDTTMSGGTGTPIMMTARLGHYEIFVKLLNIPEVELQIAGEGSVLHALLRGMGEQKFDQSALPDDADGHYRILEVLCSFIRSMSYRSDRLNIEHTDKNNMTALHYAIKVNNEVAIDRLLWAGAKLHLKDREGKSSLTSMSATIIESYFDSCIQSDMEYANPWDSDEKYIRFKYSIFKQVDQGSTTTGCEVEFFTEIESIPELKILFKHPLSKSFLFVKWCLVKKYYYVNLAFNLAFCLILSTYIFQIKDCLSSSTNSNSFWSTNTTFHQQTSSIPCNASWLRRITWLFYTVLISRELSQFFVSIRLYLSLQENWLEITMISVAGIFLATETNTHLAAIVILTSWIELIFLLGKIPLFSIYVEMFKTVALNFMKVFTLYSILVASFAYSFFILFRDENDGNALSKNETSGNATDGTTENYINSWQNPIVSLIKSIIMMTGEFDASSLPLGSNLNYSYVFFVLFVFLVTIVLYNLLNGLAVSDTRAIMEDAEVVALVSRVKLILQLERLATSNPFQYFRYYWPKFFNCRTIKQLETGFLFIRNKIYSEKIILSSRMNEDDVLISEKNKNNEISINYTMGICKVIIGKMPCIIAKQIAQILEKRRKSNLAKKNHQNKMKKHPSENESADKLVQQLREHIYDTKLENEIKVTKIDAKMTKIDVKIAEIDEKIAEINEKIVERDEKLLRRVDKRIDELIESVERVLAHLKQKE